LIYGEHYILSPSEASIDHDSDFNKAESRKGRPDTKEHPKGTGWITIVGNMVSVYQKTKNVMKSFSD